MSTTSTEEMPSGSSNPVQPASVSSSVTAHTGGVAVAPSLSGSSSPVQPASASSSITAQNSGVAVAPSLYGNTFHGTVNMLLNAGTEFKSHIVVFVEGV